MEKMVFHFKQQRIYDFSKAIVDRTLVHTTESVDVNWIRNNIVLKSIEIVQQLLN